MDTVFQYITSLQGCTTLPNTLDHSGRTHLSGVNARPRKIDTSQPYLGSTESSPPVYILSTPGSGPIARSTPRRCAQGDTSNTSAWMARSGPATMLNWTSDKALADTMTLRPITIHAWWLVCKGQRPTQNKYPNHSVLLACGDEQRLTIECEPVAPSHGLTASAQNARSCHIIILRVLSGPAQLSPRSQVKSM